MPEPDIMRFPQIIASIECEFQGRRAWLVENLDEAVAHCVRQAAQYGGSSKLTLTLSFKAKGKKMELSAGLGTQIPSPAPIPIERYIDREGRLREEDPTQTRIEFPRSAAEPGGES